jgi:hypothetical protein
MKRIIPLLLILAMLLSGCLNPPNDSAASESTAPSLNDDNMFTDNDKTEPAPEGTAITLNGSSASCDSKFVTVSGSTVTIRGAGTYVISGTLNDGSIIVNAQKSDEVTLVLYGATIHCDENAPIQVHAGKKVILTASKGTENTVSNGGYFPTTTSSNIDGAVFSMQDLTINGSGKLNILSPAGHGIVCKDNLVIAGSVCNIRSDAHGIDANDSLRFTDANLTIESGKDGIHVENSEDSSLGFLYISSGTITANSQGDGISASAYAQISGGILNLTTGGGAKNGKAHSSQGMPGRPFQAAAQTTDDVSSKGIKSGGKLTVTGGELTIDSADDAIHSNSSADISGGSFIITAGDDALHADADFTISNGNILVSESYEGLEAIHITITGGVLKLNCLDDGINAAGGNDESGGGGMDGGMFPGRPAGPGHGEVGNGSVIISGGDLYIKSSGDGVDANGTLSITGGHTVICGPTRGDTATLDYDKSGIISGGTFIGTGAAGMMAQTFSSSENQGYMSVSVANQKAGTTITLTDSQGNVLLTHQPELEFAVIILSCPQMKSGETYTLSVGTLSQEFKAS